MIYTIKVTSNFGKSFTWSHKSNCSLIQGNDWVEQRSSFARPIFRYWGWHPIQNIVTPDVTTTKTFIVENPDLHTRHHIDRYTETPDFAQTEDQTQGTDQTLTLKLPLGIQSNFKRAKQPIMIFVSTSKYVRAHYIFWTKAWKCTKTCQTNLKYFCIFVPMSKTIPSTNLC